MAVFSDMINRLNNNNTTILLTVTAWARARRQKNGDIIEYTFLEKSLKRVVH